VGVGVAGWLAGSTVGRLGSAGPTAGSTAHVDVAVEHLHHEGHCPPVCGTARRRVALPTWMWRYSDFTMRGLPGCCGGSTPGGQYSWRYRSSDALLGLTCVGGSAQQRRQQLSVAWQLTHAGLEAHVCRLGRLAPAEGDAARPGQLQECVDATSHPPPTPTPTAAAPTGGGPLSRPCPP
jgi:hypothetical protein